MLPRRIHIVGVCGTLMGSFAAYLKRAGVEVSGSDENVYPPMSDVLAKAGVRLLSGYSAKNLVLPEGGHPDLVVIGNVISRTNVEAAAVMEQKIPYTSLPEFMENHLLAHTRNIVVAGTHGKTTTSSMMAHVLAQLGANPSYFIGGVPHDLPHSFHVEDSGKYFVLEGDEYDTAFWDKVPKFNHYLPNDAILTSVEYDHADIYPDFEAVVRAFEGLADRIRTPGRLIVCVQDAVMVRLIARLQARTREISVLTYGAETTAGAQFKIANLQSRGDGITFDVMENGSKRDTLHLQLPGRHNALNALAVWIEAQELGFKPEHVRDALASFQGVKRRQEIRGEIGGVTVIDDFAHHPTAVRETLAALKAKYDGRRLLTVFEPRSATSRRKVFQTAYGEAFGAADVTFISKPYDQSKIASDQQFSSEELVSDLNRGASRAILLESAELGPSVVCQEAQEGDVIAILSNGGFAGFIPNLLQKLTSKFAHPSG